MVLKSKYSTEIAIDNIAQEWLYKELLLSILYLAAPDFCKHISKPDRNWLVYILHIYLGCLLSFWLTLMYKSKCHKIIKSNHINNSSLQYSTKLTHILMFQFYALSIKGMSQ